MEIRVPGNIEANSTVLESSAAADGRDIRGASCATGFFAKLSLGFLSLIWLLAAYAKLGNIVTVVSLLTANQWFPVHYGTTFVQLLIVAEAGIGVSILFSPARLPALAVSAATFAVFLVYNAQAIRFGIAPCPCFPALLQLGRPSSMALDVFGFAVSLGSFVHLRRLRRAP